MSSFNPSQTWKQRAQIAFGDISCIRLKLWEDKFPAINDVEANSIVFIFSSSSWQGVKMLEHLAILCRKYAHSSEKILHVHVIDPTDFLSSDYLEIEKQYGHIGIGAWKGECYFLKKGSVVGAWRGLGYIKNALEEVAQLQMLFESIYMRSI